MRYSYTTGLWRSNILENTYIITQYQGQAEEFMKHEYLGIHLTFDNFKYTIHLKPNLTSSIVTLFQKIGNIHNLHKKKVSKVLHKYSSSINLFNSDLYLNAK